MKAIMDFVLGIYPFSKILEYCGSKVYQPSVHHVHVCIFSEWKQQER